MILECIKTFLVAFFVVYRRNYTISVLHRLTNQTYPTMKRRKTTGCPQTARRFQEGEAQTRIDRQRRKMRWDLVSIGASSLALSLGTDSMRPPEMLVYVLQHLAVAYTPIAC